MRSRLRTPAHLCALLLSACFAASTAQARSTDAELERGLSGVIAAIEANQPELAMQRVEALIAQHPNFRLAHLIRGDLLLARARPLRTFGNVAKTVPRDKVEGNN